MVLQPQQPNIDINGTGNVAREYEDFRLGVRIFTDVRITIGTSKSPSQQSQAQQQAKSWKHGKSIFFKIKIEKFAFMDL